MNTEIDLPFTTLLAIYQDRFKLSNHKGVTRNELKGSVPKGSRGVYIIRRKDYPKPFYIGSSGKIGKDMKHSSSTVSSRIFNSLTPYHFSKKDHLLYYSPETSGVPPQGYFKSIELKELEIDVLLTEGMIAPTVLEHIFIQGVINEFKELPDINQKI